MAYPINVFTAGCWHTTVDIIGWAFAIEPHHADDQAIRLNVSGVLRCAVHRCPTQLAASQAVAYLRSAFPLHKRDIKVHARTADTPEWIAGLLDAGAASAELIVTDHASCSQRHRQAMNNVATLADQALSDATGEVSPRHPDHFETAILSPCVLTPSPLQTPKGHAHDLAY